MASFTSCALFPDVPLPCCAQVGTQPGTYDAALLVGDTRSAQPVEWALGEVKVRPSAAVQGGCV